MPGTFQQQIDAALRRTPAEPFEAGRVHSIPVQENVHRAAIIGTLEEHTPSGPNSVHIGAAGFFNFDIAATTHPDYMVLVDRNPAQAVFWNKVIRLMRENPHVIDFNRAYTNPKTGPGTDTLGPMGGYMNYAGQSQWVLNDDQYQYLRKMAQDGRIATVEIDLVNDQERARALGQFFRKGGYTVDTGYWSNIGSFLSPENPLGQGDNLFGDPPTDRIRYSSSGFGAYERGLLFWNGEESASGKPLTFHQLPPYERHLRIISEISGPDTINMLAAANTMRAPIPIFTQGPPRDLARIAERRAMPAQPQFELAPEVMQNHLSARSFGLLRAYAEAVGSDMRIEQHLTPGNGLLRAMPTFPATAAQDRATLVELLRVTPGSDEEIRTLLRGSLRNGNDAAGEWLRRQNQHILRPGDQQTEQFLRDLMRDAGPRPAGLPPELPTRAMPVERPWIKFFEGMPHAELTPPKDAPPVRYASADVPHPQSFVPAGPVPPAKNQLG